MHTEDLPQCSTVLCNGFIDKPKGAVLTSDEAICLIQKEEDSKRVKARAEQQEECLKELRIQQKITKKRVERERLIWKAM